MASSAPWGKPGRAGLGGAVVCSARSGVPRSGRAGPGLRAGAAPADCAVRSARPRAGSCPERLGFLQLRDASEKEEVIQKPRDRPGEVFAGCSRGCFDCNVFSPLKGEASHLLSPIVSRYRSLPLSLKTRFVRAGGKSPWPRTC